MNTLLVCLSLHVVQLNVLFFFLLSFYQISTHEIGPFSEVKLEIVWQPRIPAHADTEFVISFTDPFSESVSSHSYSIYSNKCTGVN